VSSTCTSSWPNTKCTTTLPGLTKGIAQRVPDDERDGPCATVTDIDNHQIRRKPILSGLINEYTHAA
jgi:hypothetical protein